ncbi:MAG: GlsB/YeaQ/YmgE family stress response membrane protein [Terriglobales bacterium]
MGMLLIWWIIVGLIAGWATGKIMRGAGYGPIMDVVIGIIGAIIGGAIMDFLGAPPSGGLLYTILVAILGAVVLTAIVRALASGSSRRAA